MTDTTWGDLVGQVVPQTVTVPVVVRGDLADEVARLERDLADTVRADEQLNRLPEAPAARERLAAALDAATAATVEVTFQAIGRRRWRQLLAEHPPSDEERTAGAEHAETFVWAAMAAASVRPTGATPATVEAFCDTLTDGQLGVLWAACVSVNTGVVTLPKSGTGTGDRPRTAPRSTTARPAGSPTASS